MNENNLNKALKSTIFIVSLLIIISATLIIVALFKKKNQKNNDYTNYNISQVNKIDASFPALCNPVDITFHDTYIALYSKKCNLIKIIDISHLKNYNIQY